MKKPVDENTLFTSANIVTMIRIVLVPVFVAVLLSPWPSWIDNSGNLDFLKPWVALIIFVVLSLTDSVDGYLARSRNEVTNFGKFMDPLADKILVFAALIALVELSVLPSWVVLIILMREFIISGIRMLAASSGQVIAASWYGKAKTVTQLIAIILFILKESLAYSGAQNIVSPLYIIAWIVMIIALILTIVSMVDYIYNARFVFIGDKDQKNNEDKSYEDVIKLAKDKKIKVGVAESLTGGLISAGLTSVSGASEVYVGGISSYAYEVKTKLLKVNKEKLDKHGAINEYTAMQMAKGGLEQLDSDITISTTGIAGPDKDEFNTEVGTVFIGCAHKGTCFAKKFHFKGNRDQIRKSSAQEAINILYAQLKQM